MHFNFFKSNKATLCALLVITTSLTSCNFNGKLHQKKISGNDFSKELAKEYQSLSDAEAVQYDWKSANIFAKKGLHALSGKEVYPEKVEHWKETPEHREELLQARHLLMEILNSRARETQPAQIARMQALYDCWVEQQSENWQTEDIAFCKHAFYNVAEQLKGKVHHKETKIHTLRKEEKQLKPVAHNLDHIVYFEFNKADLLPNAKKILDEIILFCKDPKNASMQLKLTLSGHADTKGTDIVNMDISKRRDDVVRGYLVNNGIEAENITAYAYGKRKLAIDTPDQTKEPLNRRVEIHIQHE